MPHDVFTQLSLVIVLAAAVSIIMRLLKQPLIIGYIITGIIAGPSFLHLIKDSQSFDAFSEIGIALLLFIIGLELSLAVIKRLGKPVFLTALTLLTVVGSLGYLVGRAFEFSVLESVLTGLALFFSSTIIIAKVLSDKKELSRLNGQIAIGVILIDDIIATLALLFVASRSGDSLSGADIGFLIAKGALLIGVLILVGGKILPKFTKQFAKSQELLFIFALAWGFGIASLVNSLGFSIEIGALFAGVALAHLPYVHQIAAKLKPLRNFFIILFFISLGESLQLGDVQSALWPAIVLSAIVLVVKPLTVIASLGILGYTRRTSFKAGINLSQISEFSIILVVLAASSGLIDARLTVIITLVALITIAISTYLMNYDNWIYGKLDRHLRIFERRGIDEERPESKVYPLVLFGFENGGQQFLRTFRSMNLPYVVVDYDPEIIDELHHKHVEYLYGDATDPELLAELNVEKSSLIINTIGDHAVNQSLIRYIRARNDEAVIICYSKDHNEAAELYELGATYVVLPHFLGSQQLSNFIHQHGLNKANFDAFREKHLVEIGHIRQSHEP